MFCPNCGKEIKEGNFCMYCGAKLPSITEKEPEKIPFSVKEEKKIEEKQKVLKSKFGFKIPIWLVVLIICATVIAVMGIALLIYQNVFSTRSSSYGSYLESQPSYFPSWHLVDTYDKEWEISSQSYTYLSVIFEKGQKIKGEVELLSGDDTSYFYILDGENYYKFKNNESFYPIVSKKAQRYFTFEFNVPETGTYYFIAGNTAWTREKVIKVKYEVYEYY